MMTKWDCDVSGSMLAVNELSGQTPLPVLTTVWRMWHTGLSLCLCVYMWEEDVKTNQPTLSVSKTHRTGDIFFQQVTW